MKKPFRRKVLAFILSILCLMPYLYAAPPKPLIDETLYVNLDAYGQVQLTNIVKTYTLNGNHTLEDFGKYSKVTNMTDFTEPQLNEDSVVWKLPEDVERFYFEGAMDEVQLPWDFDITYYLNGVPKTTEEIAGTSGYVEIVIEAIPNTNVYEYYKNNMLLQIAATFNMDEVESLRAEGAQIQAIGNTKMVMFAAMPGETQTFKIGIGTDRFISSGLTMMMVPAKLGQFDWIKGIGQKTEEIETAAKTLNDGMDIFFSSFDAISQSLVETNTGLKALQSTIELAKDSGKEVGDNHQEIMIELEGLLGTLESGMPKFQTASALIEKLYTHGNSIMDIINGSSRDLKRMKEALYNLEETLQAVENLGEDLEEIGKKQDILIKQLIQRLKDTRSVVQEVHNQFYALGGSLESSKRLLDDLNSLIGSVGVQSISNIMGDASSTLNGLAKLMGTLDDMLGQMNQMQEVVEGYSTILERYKEDGKQGLEAIQILVGEMGDVLRRLMILQEEMVLLQETMENAKPEILSFIDLMEELAMRFKTLLAQSIEQIKAVEGEITTLSPYLIEGLEGTLNGMEKTLEGLEKGLSQMKMLKASKDTISNIISQEWTALTDEMNLFHIDPDAPIISITSEKNPSPETLQIMIRTPEIMPSEQNDITVDLEAEGEKASVWDRIINIFKEIWNFIKRLFM